MTRAVSTFATSLLLLCLLAPSASAIQRQRAMNWCWAASVQDVLSQAGIFQSQPQIAARLDGWPQNRPAHIDELVALNRSYGLRSWRAGRPGTVGELVNTLRSGWKLIAFVRPTQGPVGHYVVLQGLTPRGGVILSDPWTGMTTEYSPAQLYQRWRWSDSVVVGRPVPRGAW